MEQAYFYFSYFNLLAIVTVLKKILVFCICKQQQLQNVNAMCRVGKQMQKCLVIIVELVLAMAFLYTYSCCCRRLWTREESCDHHQQNQKQSSRYFIQSKSQICQRMCLRKMSRYDQHVGFCSIPQITYIIATLLISL